MNKQWLLGCPMPQCGKLADGYFNAGPMMQDDREGNNTDDSRLQIVTDVTEADYEAYLAAIKAQGIKVPYENCMSWDKFFAFSYEGRIYHVSYGAKRGELRLVEDPDSMLPGEFGYEAKGENKTTVYQYGLYYNPENNVTRHTVNCGMVYVIRLSDNSLFIMDGGHFTQWGKESFEAFRKFLFEITETPEDGKLRISCWYCTHGHDDHLDGFMHLIDLHHDQIVLERVMHGYPSFSHCSGGYSISAFENKALILQHYPDVKRLKLHTGQAFMLSDMKVEVMYAHDDAARAEDLSKINLNDFNCTSTVLKLTIDGKTAMMLGDTNVESEAIIAANRDPKLWKADLVQVGHHCFNYLDTLYAWIGAPSAFMPNSHYGCHTGDNLPKLAAVLKPLVNDQIYYEGAGTVGLQAGEEGFVKVFSRELVGGPYDDSWLQWRNVPSYLIED